MATPLNLNKAQSSDLKALCTLEPDTFSKILSIATDSSCVIISPDDFEGKIKSALNNNSELAYEVARISVFLAYALQVEDISDPDEIKNNLQFQITHNEWSIEDKDKYKLIEERLISFLLSKNLYLIAKAINLSYSYPNLLESAKLITDIRPLFDSDANIIQGAVIANKLHIKYIDKLGNHEIEITLDTNDIKILQGECERALLKTQASKELMQEKAQVPTIVSGDGLDD